MNWTLFIYEVLNFGIVPADDMNVLVPTDYETLTLTTCYPFDFIREAPSFGFATHPFKR